MVSSTSSRATAREGRITPPVTVVLEGKARDGVEAGVVDGVTVLHAQGSGDDALVDVVAAHSPGQAVTLVTADRGLRRARRGPRGGRGRAALAVGAGRVATRGRRPCQPWSMSLSLSSPWKAGM